MERLRTLWQTVARGRARVRRARPLWRVGTEALIAEMQRRGFVVLPDAGEAPFDDSTLFYDAQAGGWTGPLGKRWPPLADDDDE